MKRLDEVSWSHPLKLWKFLKIISWSHYYLINLLNFFDKCCSHEMKNESISNNQINNATKKNQSMSCKNINILAPQLQQVSQVITSHRLTTLQKATAIYIAMQLLKKEPQIVQNIEKLNPAAANSIVRALQKVDKLDKEILDTLQPWLVTIFWTVQYYNTL